MFTKYFDTSKKKNAGGNTFLMETKIVIFLYILAETNIVIYCSTETTHDRRHVARTSWFGETLKTRHDRKTFQP